jgi:hypothetical protein
LVDANYNFLFVDIGKPGSNNDAKVWQDSNIKKALDTGALNLPKSNGKINHHFIGDDIFPLTPTLMKPYTRGDQMAIKEKIFNYRYNLIILTVVLFFFSYLLLSFLIGKTITFHILCNPLYLLEFITNPAALL